MVVTGGVALRKRLPSAWHQTPRLIIQYKRIDHLYQDPHETNPRLTLHYGDLTDSTNLIRIIQQVQPDEIYNLGAQSHVVSFESPEYTANRDALSTLRVLKQCVSLG